MTDTAVAASPAKTSTKKPKKAPAKKAPAKKAVKKTAPAKAPKVKSDEPSDRRSRGLLASDVHAIVKDFVKGKVKLDEGKLLTPTRISAIMVEEDSLETKPSPGAITNIIQKWVDVGYVTAYPKPFAFKAITAAGEREGLDALTEKAKAKAAKAKAAAKK